jgi:putative nucleotidyltransferase with HDIG domain
MVINSLTAAIEAKDPYTVGHSKRVETYSELIATQMKLSNKKIYTIKIAALFHDIGKIGINDSVLNKPDKLNFIEYDMIRKHPEISVHILESIDFTGISKPLSWRIMNAMTGRDIPTVWRKTRFPSARPLSLSPTLFDAMTSDRPYRRGYGIEKAVEIIRKEAGRQFDPDVADAFLTLYEQGRLRADKTVSELIGGR